MRCRPICAAPSRASSASPCASERRRAPDTGGRPMALTKADIVERIHERVGFSKKEASEVVDSIFEVIKGQLERGQKVKVSGFGNFVVHEKRPRKGRNPQTGETIIIRGRRVLGFKASPMLKKSMNPEA